jgi:hypothetical protein
MASQEERERRRKKLRRDAIKRDLHSAKYRQRVLPKRRRGGRCERQADDYLLDDDDLAVYPMDDSIDLD